VRLTYKRRRLFLSALFHLTIGLGGILFSMSPKEIHGGPIGLVVLILGQRGAHVFLAGICALAVLIAFRAVWLSFDGALAAEVERRGIRLQSIYYSGLLPWEDIEAVSLRNVYGWGKHPVLVVDHSSDMNILLRLVGQGDKVILSPRLLDADDDRIDAWIDAAIEAANNRGPSYQPEKRSAPVVQQPIVQQRPVFGKRR